MALEQAVAVRLSTGERITLLMNRRGMKPGELARYAGVSEASMRNYRHDLRPVPAHVLVKLARALSTTVEYLACEIEDPARSHLVLVEYFSQRG